MLVAIPSKGRAGSTTAQRIMRKSGVFFVPESEIHQYEQCLENVESVPEHIQGITATRNWILKNTEQPRVVFLDDDPLNVGYVKLYDRKAKQIKLHSEEVWVDAFMRWFDICEQIGFKVWGVKTEAALRSVYPFKPVLFKTYVTASCMGIINDGEYFFDESYPVKEDYELCLRHIRDKGGILGVRYIHWQNDHWGRDGGCKDYRTVDMERETIKKLVKAYPGMVKSAKRKANAFTVELNL